MRRITLCISIALGLAFAGPKAYSQETYALDSVAVTATRMPVALHAGARAVTFLDSAAIASAPVQTVNDLLKYSVGVDVRQRGAFGMQTDISMRGGTYNQVAVLLNGINITDPQTGHNSFIFPVNMGDIDHIEVVEGPAARVYGSSAMVGAINIVTKGHSRQASYSTMGDADLDGRIWHREESRKSHSLFANLEGGSFGYCNANGSWSMSGNRNYHNISFGVSRSNGYSRCSEGTSNSDFTSAKLFYNGGRDWSKRNLTWQAGLTGNYFGASTFYSPKYDNQFERTAKAYFAVRSEGRGKLHFTPAVYWNYGEDEFQLFRGEPEKYPYNYHRTNVLGANINCHVDTRLGRTAFGAEARHEAIRSTNLGEKLDNPKGVYVCGLGRTAYSAFVDHKVNVGWFCFSGGVTAAYNTGNTEGVKLFPGGEISLRFPAIGVNGEGTLYTSYNSSYRMPTFTDLYYSVGGHKADPNLKSEKLNALEFGFKLSEKGFRMNGSMFFNTGYDMIDWIMDTSAGSDAPWTSINHSLIKTFGKECTFQLDIPQIFQIERFFIKDLTLAVISLSQSKDLEENLRSLYSMEYIREKFTASANLNILKRLSANVSYIYVDRATGSELIKPYHLLDAKLNYDANDLQVYLRANNILNRTYYDFGDIPQPGFWFIAGISLKLGY
ncbi:MAG: TonB-dependent receptor [Bacteroidales bacterium]|nr:TonB-dependent receptor [Bacteroidales bacterium]